MTTTPDRLDRPARRRRHARLLLALTELIGACAEAAGAVYGPIAAAPPGQEAVTTDLMPCIKVSLSAATLLDRARAEDEARWPAAVEREREEARRTYAARCAVAQAQALLEEFSEEEGFSDKEGLVEKEPGPSGVPVPTAQQATDAELISAGDEVAAQWLTDPEQAVARVRELTVGGELAASEILDQAVDSAVLSGLLALQGARTTPDPSTAAEQCVAATPYLALAVTLASVDLD
ncbi:hypothetical protein [Streptomyces specialis]|uniref:hypothetical protein n=1 Tax=Streptomyces specialis TaxID=498367 RepID=UPI00073F9EF9|nr:hypothetical protein [Streptomyces specialis]